MKKSTKGLVALFTAVAIGVAWNSQQNPPKVYVDGTRIHHYQVGGLLALLGLIFGSPAAVGFGTGLVLHDIDDVPL